MIKRLATIASLVVITSFVALAALVGCGGAGDGSDDGRENTSALTASEDGGADSGNPADNSTLGAPNVSGASPVQPSPWDHLITGASK